MKNNKLHKLGVFTKRFSQRRLASLLGILTIAVSTTTCSAILDFTECRTDVDCGTFFIGDQPTFCVENACKVGPCEENAQCEQHSENSICNVGGFCTAMDSACENPVYPGNNELPVNEIVFVGSIASTSADDTNSAVKSAIQLAVSDFNTQTSLEQNKKVAWIHCDPQGDADVAVRVAKFLAAQLPNEIETYKGSITKAIVGPFADNEFVKVVNEVILQPEGNAFIISPTSIIDHDRSADDYNLVWKATPGASRYAAALAKRIEYIVANEDLGISENGYTALVYAENILGNNLHQAFAKPTESNKKGTIPGVSNLQIFSNYDVADPTKAAPLELLVKYDPEMLILFGGDEIKDFLIAYHGRNSENWPKYILTTDRGSSGVLAAVAEIDSPNVTSSFTIIAPDLPSPDRSGEFLERFTAEFPNETVTTPNVQLAYDATVVLLMSMLTIEELTGGLTIAESIDQVVDANSMNKISITQNNFFENAKPLFNQGETIDLQGASSDLNLATETQDNCTNFVAWEVVSGNLVKKATYTVNNCPNVDGEWDDNI